MSYLNHFYKSKYSLKNSNTICKFYIVGHCTRKNCPYKHSIPEYEKWINNQEGECIMYNNGYCKEGPLCKYIHNHKDNLENINIKEDEQENYPIIPIWCIEHYFSKSITDIYNEFVNSNLSKVIGLICKYSNNVDFIINKINTFINSDIEIKYFLIRGSKNEIEDSLETNFVNIGGDLKNIKIFNENINIIIFIINDETDNLYGFAKIKNKSKKNKDYKYKIQWLWIEEIDKSEIEPLKNPKDNYNKLINCANGCEIDKNLGNILIKFITEKLSKKELNEYFIKKNDYHKNRKKKKEDNQVNSIQINNVHVNINNNTVNNYNSINYFNSENKKRKRNDIDN